MSIRSAQGDGSKDARSHPAVYHTFVLALERWKDGGSILRKPELTREKLEAVASETSKRQHPEIGYQRLTYMMIDEGMAAVTTSSVYNVLAQVELSSRSTPPPGGSHKQGLD